MLQLHAEWDLGIGHLAAARDGLLVQVGGHYTPQTPYFDVVEGWRKTADLTFDRTLSLLPRPTLPRPPMPSEQLAPAVQSLTEVQSGAAAGPTRGPAAPKTRRRHFNGVRTARR